jgi:hypothetical protein
MPKELLQTVERVDTVILPNRQEIQNPTGETDYEIIKAAPNSDPTEFYLRKQHQDGRSFRWSGPVADWTESTPADDNRWIAE